MPLSLRAQGAGTEGRTLRVVTGFFPAARHPASAAAGRRCWCSRWAAPTLVAVDCVAAMGTTREPYQTQLRAALQAAHPRGLAAAPTVLRTRMALGARQTGPWVLLRRDPCDVTTHTNAGAVTGPSRDSGGSASGDQLSLCLALAQSCKFHRMADERGCCGGHASTGSRRRWLGVGEHGSGCWATPSNRMQWLITPPASAPALQRRNRGRAGSAASRMGDPHRLTGIPGVDRTHQPLRGSGGPGEQRGATSRLRRWRPPNRPIGPPRTKR